MRVGFTGTRRGMSQDQLRRLKQRLLELAPIDEFHHGDCRGADEQAHDLVRSCTFARIVVHPPTDDDWRAFCVGDLNKIAKPYLTRNHDIVSECDILLAVPKGEETFRGSGTWATVRYARRVGLPVEIL